MPQMKILVIGVYYASNLGDAVICDCTASLLQKQFPEASIEIADLCGRHDFVPQKRRTEKEQKQINRDDKKYKWITKWTPWDFAYKVKFGAAVSVFPYIDELCGKSYDLAVFAGGQLFMDWLSPYVCRFVENFQKKQVPVLFHACGTGPAVSPKLRKMLKEALCASCVRFISTRDDRETIEKWYTKGKKEVVSTYDPALWAAEQYGIARQKSDVIGLGIMFAANLNPEKVIKFWVRLIREMEARNLRWRIFCNGDMDDFVFGEHVLNQIPEMEKDHSKYRMPCPKQPNELVREIAQFQSIISFRLHSHIIAGSLGIPGVAIVWDEKLSFYYRNLGCEERCMTIQASPKEVLRRLAQAEEEGCPTERIRQQRQYARDRLLDAVRQCSYGLETAQKGKL